MTIRRSLAPEASRIMRTSGQAHQKTGALRGPGAPRRRAWGAGVRWCLRAYTSQLSGPNASWILRASGRQAHGSDGPRFRKSMVLGVVGAWVHEDDGSSVLRYRVAGGREGFWAG